MLTEEQIIKAKELIKKLEEAYNAYYDTSKGMPYDIDKTLRESAICIENALAEINRQKAELERLQKHNTEMARKYYQDGKAEAVKEFAERLKAKAFTNNYWHEVVFVSEIDNLVKEFTEGG